MQPDCSTRVLSPQPPPGTNSRPFQAGCNSPDTDCWLPTCVHEMPPREGMDTAARLQELLERGLGKPDAVSMLAAPGRRRRPSDPPPPSRLQGGVTMTSSSPPTDARAPGDYIHAVRRQLTDDGSQVTACGFVLPRDWPPQKGRITCPVCRHVLAQQTAEELP